MINVIFRDLECEIMPKRLETYEKYCKILRWGRRNPTRFLETFMFLEFTDHQKWILLNCWCKSISVILASRSSGKSYMTSPITMAYSLLFPNHHTYFMAPSGNQSQETFTKLEDLAKGNIASALGVSPFFLMECVKQNAKADPFTHDKNSYEVKLFNGSSINTLNSVAKTIVGIRLILGRLETNLVKRSEIWKKNYGVYIFILTKLMVKNMSE